MEPLSIIGTSADVALAAFKVARAIASFKKNVDGIDQSVEQLEYQVNGLGSVLTMLNEELKQPEYDKHSGKAAQTLIEQLPKTIGGCQSTLGLLGDRLGKLQAQGKKNLMKQSWRAIKLQWSQSDIDDYLGKVKMHSMNLQLALGALSLHNSVHQQDAITTDLNERFDKLEQMLLALANRVSINGGPATQSDNEYLAQVPIDDCTTSLMQGAQTIVSSASTATGRSSSGGTVITDEEPAFEFIGESTMIVGRVYEETTTGSELGTPLDPRQRMNLQSWLQHTQSLKDIGEERPSPHPLASGNTVSSDSHLSSPTRNFSESGASVGTATQSSDLFYSSEEDEDDVETELVAKIFKSAKNKASCELWDQSRTEFLEGLQLVQHFSPTRCAKLGVLEMKLHLATCTRMIGMKESGEEILLSVAQAEPADATTLAWILKAQRLLAAWKLDDANLKSAEAYCRQALHGQRKARSIGKTHPDYYESLELMSLIMLANGQSIQAKHYAEFLPEERKRAAQSLLSSFSNDSAKQALYPLMVSIRTSKDEHVEPPSSPGKQSPKNDKPETFMVDSSLLMYPRRSQSGGVPDISYNSRGAISSSNSGTPRPGIGAMDERDRSRDIIERSADPAVNQIQRLPNQNLPKIEVQTTPQIQRESSGAIHVEQGHSSQMAADKHTAIISTLAAGMDGANISMNATPRPLPGQSTPSTSSASGPLPMSVDRPLNPNYNKRWEPAIVINAVACGLNRARLRVSPITKVHRGPIVIGRGSKAVQSGEDLPENDIWPLHSQVCFTRGRFALDCTLDYQYGSKQWTIHPSVAKTVSMVLPDGKIRLLPRSTILLPANAKILLKPMKFWTISATNEVTFTVEFWECVVVENRPVEWRRVISSQQTRART